VEPSRTINPSLNAPWITPDIYSHTRPHQFPRATVLLELERTTLSAVQDSAGPAFPLNATVIENQFSVGLFSCWFMGIRLPHLPELERRQFVCGVWKQDSKSHDADLSHSTGFTTQGRAE